MSIDFTLTFTAAGTPDYASLTQLESGKWRDVNGNSFSARELDGGATVTDAFTVSMDEGQCDEHSVAELVELLQGEATAIAMAYLTGEQEEIHLGGYTFTLPQDSNRGTYVREGATNPLIGTDEHVPTYLPLLAPAGITVHVTAHRPLDEIIRSEQ